MTAAEEVVTLPGWAWLPGMSDAFGCRVVELSGGRIVLHDPGDAQRDVMGEHVAITCIDERDQPNLDDPATLGCLLDLVRKAWRDPTGYVACDRHGDEWACIVGGRQFVAATESEALVAALKAAPS